MKKTNPILLAALLAVTASAGVIFDGSTDTVFKATSDNSNVSLTSLAGIHTLTNSSASDQDAYIFGTFPDTILSKAGDSLTLSFRVNNMPDNAGMRFVLAGARGAALITNDVASTAFPRSYASYGIDKKVDNIGTDFFNYDGGSAGDTTADRPLLGDTGNKIGSWNSATGADRFDNASTADFTFTITRETAAFDVSGTMEVAGGSGIQTMTNFSFSPVEGNNDLLLTDAFTTFGIGCQGYAAAQLDAGSSLSISGLSVSHTAVGTGDNRGLPYAACHPPGLTYYTAGPFANLLWSCGSLWNPVGNWVDKTTGTLIRRTLDTNGTVTAGSQIDRFGNPQYLDPGQVINAVLTIPSDAQLDGHPVYVGKMALTWQGAADIRLNITGTQVTGTTSGVVTNGRREWAASQTSGAIRVEIHGIDTNNPPHNICLWAPDPSDWTNSTLEGELLHPSMEARLQDADWGYVRYMDLQSTIMTREKEWQDRRLPADCFQVGPINTVIPSWQYVNKDGGTNTVPEQSSCVGMAYEHIIRMCNETQIDPWVCVPFDASPAYMTNMANLFLHGSDGENPYTSAVTNPAYPPLDSNLKIYLEFANEVWNYRQRDLQADRGTLTDGQYTARKFSDTWDIFESVLGTNRIVRTAAVWTLNFNGFATDLLDELYTNSVLLKPEVIAGTTYFGNGIQNWVWEQILETNAPPASYWTSPQFTNDMNTAFDQWLRLAITGVKVSGDTGPDGVAIQGIPDYLRDFCYSNDVPLICYEGGPSIYTDHIDTASDTNGFAVTDFMIAMNAHPRMAEIYDLQMQMAKEDGLYSHMPFLLYEEWGKFGQWGHLRALHDDPDEAVKYSYILDFIDECKNKVRHVYDPLNNVPSFTTAEELPYILEGEPCSLQIETTGGDGARSNKVIAALLPDGLSIDSSLCITGTPTEAGEFHLYVRVIDGDGDPAWSFFRLTVLEAEVGLPLVEWEFLNAGELDARTNAFQVPDSTYNAGNMMSGTIGNSSGLIHQDNSLYNDDCYAVRELNTASMDTNAYIYWTAQPASGYEMELRSLEFGITGNNTSDDFHVELQYSLDGFATTGTVMTLSTNTFVGGGNTAAGVPVFVSLTNCPALQNCDQEVEFRLYLWGLGSAYYRVHFGKQYNTLEGDLIDLRISGLTAAGGSALDAPSNLAVSVIGSTSLSLTWNDNSDNEDGFRIERKSGTSSFAQITSVTAGTTTCIDSGLTSGTTYTYRVCATNSSEDSGYSNEASGTPAVQDANLIHYDGFAYGTAAGVDLPTASTGIYTKVNSGSTTTDVTTDTGMSFSGLTTVGLSANLDAQSGGSCSMTNTQSFESLGTVYMSALFTADTGGAGWSQLPMSAVILNQDGAVGTRGLTFGITAGNTSGSADELHAFIGIDTVKQTASSGVYSLGSTNLIDGATYFMVAKFDITNASANQAATSLAVYDTAAGLPSSEPAAWNAVNGQSKVYAWPLTGSGELDELVIWQDNAPGDSNQTDEIRIGTTWSSVVPVSTSQSSSSSSSMSMDLLDASLMLEAGTEPQTLILSTVTNVTITLVPGVNLIGVNVESDSLADLLGSQLLAGDTLQIYDETAQEYLTVSDLSAESIPAGGGFLLSTASARDITLTGSAGQPKAIRMVSGMQIVASPVSQDAMLQSMGLNGTGSANYTGCDKVSVWVNGSYLIYGLNTNGIWYNAGDKKVWRSQIEADELIEAGEAFWYEARFPFIWNAE
ncbi:hypothetical protein PDESU_03664 [Pontiella desulfatans]|uniref:Fibronectin type-III domain-containing protein n=1 Tax=Pontiella desulfatans TaxID=2750659 RepID=A0A6C2U6N3_PONDE|nr:fibronectin type III domain-containing protein [Pontiella desulfatans]VGO15084.1 hypothetical protein PDESU_03664 [Pontiella desulfatans]